MSKKLINCKTCKNEIAKSAKVCPNCGAKMKKPFYMNWFLWLIAIIGIVVISQNAMKSGGDESTIQTSKSDSSSAQPAQPAKTNSVKGGQYKVGTDITAGEYVLVTKKGAKGSFQITKDSTAEYGSGILGGMVTNRLYVMVEDGQYIKIGSCDMYKTADAPKPDLSDGYYIDGVYKVGVDIPAGEHKVISTGEDAYVAVKKDPGGVSSIISNDLFANERYITVKDGQYLELTNAKIKSVTTP